MWNFIEHLIETTKEAESPTEFWRWSAISALSAVLRDNVVLDCPIGAIFPNMYIILFSDSGIARKAAPCKFAGKLVQHVGNTKFIAGRATMQAVVRELGRAYTNERGDIIQGAAGLLYSEELSSFVVDDPASIPLFIDLYDYHEKWASNLISINTALKNVCLGLLAASNSDLFNSVYTEKAIKGGLLGRTLIIKQDRPRHRRSLFDMKPIDSGVDQLKKHLVRISRLKGSLTLLPEALLEYNSWYKAIPDEVFVDRIGFGSRLGTHVAKLSISLAASREDFDKSINKLDIEQAISICQDLRGTYKSLSFGIGSSSTSYLTSLVLKAIVSSEKFHITREKLIQRTFGDIESAEVLDRVLLLMVQGGIVEERSLSNFVGYKLTVKGYEMLTGGTTNGSEKA